MSTEALTALQECMFRHPRCGAAGCRLIDASGREQATTRSFLTPWNQALELLGPLRRITPAPLRRTHRPRLNPQRCDCGVDWIEGSCLMLRRAALENVGMFDERFFMYSEDEDLCFRLRKNRWSVCFSAAGTAIHEGGASACQYREAMLEHFYASQMLFLIKHRGMASYYAYVALMRTVLRGKRVYLRLVSKKSRSEEMAARIDALERASSSLIIHH
jgi:GT2 family glycosyltransferase